MFDVSSGQATQVAQHEAPIKAVKWVDAQNGILATGSWDKTLKVRFIFLHLRSQLTDSCQYWDLRSSTPVATVALPERCYTFDVQYPLLAVGTADRHIQIFNLSNPSTPYKVLDPLVFYSFDVANWRSQTLPSPLKWQTRVITCFTQSTNAGFAIGSVEGRVAIQ
jgi:mRNA export factor